MPVSHVQGVFFLQALGDIKDAALNSVVEMDALRSEELLELDSSGLVHQRVAELSTTTSGDMQSEVSEKRDIWVCLFKVVKFAHLLAGVRRAFRRT